MSEHHRKEYLSRIHRAQDYIEKNLNQSLSLDDIAREACFSPYHFHRIFSSVTGETLYQFILRLRLERAATTLCQNNERSITEIAIDLGFSSSATFARSFQAGFGMSASEFRKNCKTDSKDWKATGSGQSYLELQALKPDSMEFKMKPVQAKQPVEIKVVELTNKTLAYVRHVGPYAGNNDLFDKLWGQIFQWAGPRGLAYAPGSEMISIYHDNPEITEQNKLRLSLGITVPPSTQTSPPVNLMEIRGGKYVCAKFEISVTEYGNAWAYVMGEWLPQSGYQCDERPCYECYLNDPKTHPEGKHIVEIRVAVKPL